MTLSPHAKAPPPARPSLHEKLARRDIDGPAFCAANTAAMDQKIQAIAKRLLSPASHLCLIALGGYGRKELCPGSDIDLLFLASGTMPEIEAAAIEKFLYALWDEGLKVGHAVRSIEECLTLSRKDSKVLTTHLDARLLQGDSAPFKSLQDQLKSLLSDDEKYRFLRDKLKERDDRHVRYGDTRYVLEPNIKEGKGGLRDFQTLLWITDVIYDARTLDDLVRAGVLTASESRRFKKAHEFLLTVRCHLHDIAGRAEERLHFDIQPDLAERLGYANRNHSKAVERFMKHYFLVTRDIGDLTRILCAAIESGQEDQSAIRENFFGFQDIGGRLSFGEKQNLKKYPVEMLRLFRASQETGKDIHPHALKDITRHIRELDTIREDDAANHIFLEILTSPTNASQTLRRMNEAGILGRFIPDFGRVIALMQFDRYHHFTVDEHTLRCIDMLHRLENGNLQQEAPVTAQTIKTVRDRTSLYTAIFLHDICKGRGGDHAQLGAELALSFCPRLGLDGAQTDLVSWLILEHLLMSDTAFRRNLNDPKTIADFSARVRTPERLDLLFCLTTADIMGVGPGRWTAWKARLLEELYDKTKALMHGMEPGMIAEITVPPDYTPGETRIDITYDEAQSASVVVVYTPDRPGLFATLCGALSSEGASIMRAYINTLPGRLAVDRFVIQNSSSLPFRQEHRINDLRQTILQALDGELDIDARIAAHKKPPGKKDLVFNIPPEITINNAASGTDTVVEIETRDRHGLLFDIASVFVAQNLDIRAAKINTQGLRAIDAFYIQTAKHKKLVDLPTQQRLIEILKATVAKA